MLPQLQSLAFLQIAGFAQYFYYLCKICIRKNYGNFCAMYNFGQIRTFLQTERFAGVLFFCSSLQIFADFAIFSKLFASFPIPKIYAKLRIYLQNFITFCELSTLHIFRTNLPWTHYVINFLFFAIWYFWHSSVSINRKTVNFL